MVKKFSELTLDSTPGAGSYVPYVDPTEEVADRNKRILVGNLTSATSSYLDAVADFGLSTSNTGVQNVAALQAMFDELSVSPGKAIIPSSGYASYPVEGSVIMTDSLSANFDGFEIDATGAIFQHTGGGVLFDTRAIVDMTDAANTTGYRARRRWKGGRFKGDNTAGSICFRFMASKYLHWEDIHISGFDEGIHGEFVLDSWMGRGDLKNNQYNINIGSGTWASATPAASASNMTILEGWHLAGTTATARVRIADSGGIVLRDSTSEGSGPPIHVWVENNNTSAMLVDIQNMWIESDATTAAFLIDSKTHTRIDLAHYVGPGGAPAIKCLDSGLVTVRNMGYLPGGPHFEYTHFNQKWRFDGISDGEFDPRDTSYWVGGLVSRVFFLGEKPPGKGAIIAGESPRAVTGSRADTEAALADLLTELATLGIISDGTSV